MKKICTLFFMLLFWTTYSQEKYEYFGVLNLNGNSKSVITYRLVFSEKNGILNGFSISDLGGENETKNIIEGSFNKKTKELIFSESDILYTKSKSTFTVNDFCFVNFAGKVKFLENNSKIEGDFKGLYKNKKKCINGTISLVGSVKLYKLLNKINNKLQKSKKVDAITKNKVNPISILDSIKDNNLLKNQNLNIFVKTPNVSVEIWDAKVEDGDKINLYQNNKLILENYEILTKKKKLEIALDNGQNIFRIEAINEGSSGINTVSIKIIDGERILDLVSNLKKNEQATITINKSTN